MPEWVVEVTVAMGEVGVRPYRAYDGDGAFVGDFAAWLPAHRWAHERAVEPGTRLPVEVEDRSRLHVEQVWPDRCQTLHAGEPAVSATCPLVAVGESSLRVLPGGRHEGTRDDPDGDTARGLPGGRGRRAGAVPGRSREGRR